MRRALGLFLVFVIGIGVGWFVLRSLPSLPFGRAGESAAQQRVLSLLNQPASTPTVPDTALVKAAQRIEPTVVNIETVGPRIGQIPGTPFEQLYMMQGRGSGVIIGPDGFIATNNHVIDGADVIRVTMADGRRFDGRLVGADPDADLAVVKIDGRNLPTAELGDSDRLKVGEYVLAIGYPLGLGTTVTHGIISATDRENLPVSEGRVLQRALQTDAPINKGNSGGALANSSGQLVGINTAIASENGGGSIGIGFAIPVNAARSVLRQIIARGTSGTRVASGRPFLGVRFAPVTPELSAQYSLPASQGVVILSVLPLSPAANAGLTRGSIVVAMDDQPVKDANDLRSRLAQHHPGDKVTLSLLRGNGAVDKVPVTMGHWPAGAAQQ